ncbi:hypothetical protein F842_YJM1078B00174 [Saccharomyces cerevisiae YJM1078]|nr:hypothetical protein F842_YJM1078B00174 [Saccharomyces cerevisiae YJM1078]AJQ00838.1 hypothetical protein H751_YJM248B00173 [Saccharomyces cerevisiae YJM248]AJQ08092.1 hypothetical protein H790_YJM1252B00173 [Saccharomyces cerevisiae YJM1252]
MEELSLKSTFPYEYGSDFRMTRLEILNSTKKETTLLFSNIGRILASIWKYSCTFLRSFSDSIKVIIHDVVTIGSRDLATRLQIEAQKNNDQEDIWASTVLLGVIIGYLIFSFRGKNAFLKIHKNSTEVDECSLKTSEHISIVINFSENNLSNRGNIADQKNSEEFMVPHLKESVIDILIPNMVTVIQSDENLIYDVFDEYDLLSHDNTTEALVRPYQSNPDYEAMGSGISIDSANETRLRNIERSIGKGEKMVKKSIGCNVSLLHHSEQSAPKNNAITRSSSAQDNAGPVTGEVNDMCKSFLIMGTRLGNELFLTMFMKEPVFLGNSVSITEIGIFREKRERLDAVTCKSLTPYDELRSMTRNYNLRKIESQRNRSTKNNNSVPPKKLLMNEKDAISILLWYSTRI